MSSSLLAHRGLQALSVLEAHGIVPPPGNRLRRAVKLIDDHNSGILRVTRDDPDGAARALEAMRTLFDAFVVTWTLTEFPRIISPFPKDRLRYLLEGADLPTEDSNPKARNTQFELLVGAALVLGGADIVPEEPDYQMFYHGSYVGVAVKRVSSLKPGRVSALLREARKQLSASGGRGFVAVSLDRWITDLGADDPQEVGRLFNRQLQAAQREIVNVAQRETIIGAMIFGNWNTWRFEGDKPRLEWRAPVQFVGFADNPEDTARFDSFFGPLFQRWTSSIATLGKLLDPSEQSKR